MKSMKSILLFALAFVAVTPAYSLAANSLDSSKAAPLSVAVLDFAATDPAQPELGKDIAAAVAAMLTDKPGIKLVDRRSLAKTLEEQEINMTGLVDSSKAIKIGKLAGAKIVVTGRAFKLGSKVFIAAKIIGTETSLTEGLLVKGDASADLGELTVKLADDLAVKLQKVGPKLVAQAETKKTNPLKQLKHALAGRKLPVVAVIVREQHHASPRPQLAVIDPAAETEIKKLLLECGFQVQDVPENHLTDFTRNWKPGIVARWPRGLEKVDILIAGEAFSEFASRIGNIVNCAGRVEINVIRRADGKVTLSDRMTTRASDLSENIAGKKALQEAGHKIGIHLLEHFNKTLPASSK